MTLSPLLIRALSLYIPISLAFLIWLWYKPAKQESQREIGAMLLATCYALVSLPFLNWFAIHFNWWHFNVEGGLFLDLPLDILIGWVILWGIVPAQLEKFLSIPYICIGLLLTDVIFMPLFAPVLILGKQWLIGEIVGVIIVLLPATYLARWIRRDTCLYARMVFVGGIYIVFIFALLPAILLEQTGSSFQIALHVLLTKPFWLLSLLVQLTLLLPAIMGLSAVQEFVVRGRGTPIPFDPPKYLVTSGLYGYLANPMQMATGLALLSWGFLLGSLWISAASLMVVIYDLGIASQTEQEEMPTRFGQRWARYRQQVHNWWPRWHLAWSADQPPAQLYVAMGCDPCSELGQWIAVRQPIGLAVVAAETYPGGGLTRVTYEVATQAEEDREPYQATGIAALARAMEHINLGWALIGALIRLPLFSSFLQFIIDGIGGGPQAVTVQTDEISQPQICHRAGETISYLSEPHSKNTL